MPRLRVLTLILLALGVAAIVALAMELGQAVDQHEKNMGGRP